MATPAPNSWRISFLIRWFGGGLAILLTLLFLLNLPFYAGSALPLKCNWRLEHGRMKIQRTTTGSTESFYIDFNSEGLRFLPQGRFYNLSDWMVNIPLWMPILALGVPAACMWRQHLRSKKSLLNSCRTCGYDRTNAQTKVCPECGSAENPRTI